MTSMHPDARIYVAGHRGLVGNAIVRGLLAAGHTDIITRTQLSLPGGMQPLWGPDQRREVP